MMCVAHQLKQVDFQKVAELMRSGAYVTFNQIFFLIVAGQQKLEGFIGRDAEDIEGRYEAITRAIQRRGADAIRELENQLKSGWGWFSYLPPESRGAVIRSVADVCNNPANAGNNELRTTAAFTINELIATTQSSGHLENTLDRITVGLGTEPGRRQGTQMINAIVAGTKFAGCIERCEMQLTKASPLMGRPFLRNDEHDFILAQFPLHHPAYTVA
jgi:hypothetical protein